MLLRTKIACGQDPWAGLIHHTVEAHGCLEKIMQDCLFSALSNSLQFVVRESCLAVLSNSLNHLDRDFVSKAFKTLSSIIMWSHLTESFLEEIFDRFPIYRKRFLSKMRVNSARRSEKKEALALQSWLHTFVLDLMVCLNVQRADPETLSYCIQAIKLLIEFISRDSTRRYSVVLLRDLQIVSVIKLSFRFCSKPASRPLLAAFDVLKHYVNFPYDDYSGMALKPKVARVQHSANLAKLQRIAFMNFREALPLLSLSNMSAIDTAEELRVHLYALEYDQLLSLCDLLHLRTQYSDSRIPRSSADFLREIVVNQYDNTSCLAEWSMLYPLLPTEVDCAAALYEQGYSENCLPNQSLCISDYYYRLARAVKVSSFAALWSDVLKILENLQRRTDFSRSSTQELHLHAASDNSMGIENISITEILPPRITAPGYPAAVRADVHLTRNSVSSDMKQSNWDVLKPGDLLFFCCVDKEYSDLSGTNLRFLRCAQLEQILYRDESSARLVTNASDSNDETHRVLRVLFDPETYQRDEAAEVLYVYDSLNIVVKRKMSKNNFQNQLRILRSLATKEADDSFPSQFTDLFLGKSKHAPSLPSCSEMNFYDTFIDTNDAKEALSKMLISKIKIVDKVSIAKQGQSFCTVLSSSEVFKFILNKDELFEATVPELDLEHRVFSDLPGSSCGLVQNGQLQYTTQQVRAILMAMTSSWTVIDGVPGSGKQLVACQVIKNLYYGTTNRTIVICKTEEYALKFCELLHQKDIEQRHIFNVSETDSVVRRALERRAWLLKEVGRLATLLNTPGDHDASCEHAQYFFKRIIEPRWNLIEGYLKPLESLAAFYSFLPEEHKSRIGKDDTHWYELSASQIRSIFDELRELQPIELLVTTSSRFRFLLTHIARVVVCTSSELLKNYAELASLLVGFDTTIFLQAGSIYGLEATLPFCIGQLPSSLMRVVLVADSQQECQAMDQSYMNSESNSYSLFMRVVKSGCPVVSLKDQGRTRTAIASLYQTRHSRIANMSTTSQTIFKQANGGLLYPAQLINVVDYQGHGEISPGPNSFQNLGEAEYVVALFQYMRLLAYPVSLITVLTPYRAQKALLQEIFEARCRNQPQYGMPRVMTLSEMDGISQDYVLVSLVRTTSSLEYQNSSILNALTSRARLGLYVFARREVISEAAPWLASQLDVGKSSSLMLVPGEAFLTTRPVNNIPDEVIEISGVESLGKYVYKMACH